jgi:hypothetical protein
MHDLGRKEQKAGAKPTFGSPPVRASSSVVAFMQLKIIRHHHG